MLSKGPVHLTQAGNGKTKRKFTSAFQTFFKTQALTHLKDSILPEVEADLRKTVEMQIAANGKASVKAGMLRSKKIGVSGFAGEERATFQSAKAKVQAALKKQEDFWTNEARERRRNFYGV
jgi:hypothetical protein